jgi:hypothetical protein
MTSHIQANQGMRIQLDPSVERINTPKSYYSLQRDTKKNIIILKAHRIGSFAQYMENLRDSKSLFSCVGKIVLLVMHWFWGTNAFKKTLFEIADECGKGFTESDKNLFVNKEIKTYIFRTLNSLNLFVQRSVEAKSFIKQVKEEVLFIGPFHKKPLTVN